MLRALLSLLGSMICRCVAAGCVVCALPAVLDARPLAVPPADVLLQISPANLHQGDTVTYTITARGSADLSGSLHIAQLSDLKDADFDRTLAQAIAAALPKKGAVFDGSGKLTFSRGFSGTLSFSRKLRTSPRVGSIHQVRLYRAEKLLLLQPTAVALVGTPTVPRNPSMVRGVNASGGEFGTVPGTYATNYIYPSQKEIAAYARQGFKVVRLPFRWERVQHRLYGDMDQRFDGAGDFDRLRRVVAWITGEGMIAVLDPHDFGARRVGRVSAKIGSALLPTSAFEDLWVRLARVFKGNDRVWFNLMNEPNGVSASHWKAVAQSTTNTIRAAGAFNRILVPGTAYTGAHSWISSGNAAEMAEFVDPAHNFAFDVHQYLDSDSSGTHGTCVRGAGARRLDPFITWARAKPGRYGFLGEFAAGDPTVRGQKQCAIELHALLDALEGSGVFIGWTAWGAGPWWGSSYIFRLEPAAFGAREPQYLRILKSYLR